MHSKYSLNLKINDNYHFFYMKYIICQADMKDRQL